MMTTDDWNLNSMDNLQDLVTTQTLEEDGDGQAEPTDLWTGNEPAEDAYAELTEEAAEQADEPADAYTWIAQEMQGEADKEKTADKVKALKQLALDEAAQWWDDNRHMLKRDKKNLEQLPQDEQWKVVRPQWAPTEEQGLKTMQLSGAPVKNGTCKAGHAKQATRPTEERTPEVTLDLLKGEKDYPEQKDVWWRDGHSRKVGAPQCQGHTVQGHTGVNKLKKLNPNDGLVVQETTPIQPWHLADADYKQQVKEKGLKNQYAAAALAEPYNLATDQMQVILRPGMEPLLYGVKPEMAVEYTDWNGLKVAVPTEWKASELDRVDELAMWTVRPNKKHAWTMVPTDLSPTEKREKTRVLRLPQRVLGNVTWVLGDTKEVRGLDYADVVRSRGKKHTGKLMVIAEGLTNWKVTAHHEAYLKQQMQGMEQPLSLEGMAGEEGALDDWCGVTHDNWEQLQTSWEQMELEPAKPLTMGQEDTLVKRCLGLALEAKERMQLQGIRKKMQPMQAVIGR